MSNSDSVSPRFEAAAQRLDGDVELLREMAAITSEDLPDVQAEVREVVEAGECDLAAEHLHRLKGMLSTFESDGVTIELHEMIFAARKGDTDELQRRFQENEPKIYELIGEISQLAEQRSADSGSKR